MFKFIDIHGFYLNARESKIFKYLLTYSFLLILPIILADVYYVDDIGRSMDGNAAWKNDGRPLMLIMARIFSNGNKLMPVFPLPLILAVVLLSYSLVLLARRISTERNPLIVASALAFFFTNLFILENFSYSYEAFGMILALCLFSLLFVVFENPRGKRYFVISFLVTMISVCTYQAAIGAYLGFIIIESVICIRKNIQPKNILVNVIARLIPFIISVVIYKLTIARALVKIGYAKEHAGAISFFSEQGLHQIGLNFLGFLDMWKIYFFTMGPVLTAGIVLILVLSAYFMVREYRKQLNNLQGWKEWSVELYIACSSIAVAIAAILPFLFLQNPTYAPRVFLSFSIFTMYLGFLLCYVGQHCKYMYVFLPLFLLFNLSFSSAYGIALNREDKHDAQIAQYIVYDLNQIEQQQGKRYEKISILGTEQKCKEVELLSKKKPLMGRLIPGYMTTDWYWAGKYIEHYRLGKMDNEKLTDEDKEIVTSAQPLRENEYYELYTNEDKAIIVFQKESSK